MPMDISELKSKKIVELNELAKELNIAGYSDLRKQELIFKILEAQKYPSAFVVPIILFVEMFFLKIFSNW